MNINQCARGAELDQALRQAAQEDPAGDWLYLVRAVNEHNKTCAQCRQALGLDRVKVSAA